METVFICINVELGSDHEVLKNLKQINGVKEVHQVFGVYDLVVKIQADSTEKIKRIVIEQIRKINKIKTTLTMIVQN